MLRTPEPHSPAFSNDEDAARRPFEFQIAHAIRGRLRVRMPILINKKERILCESRYLSKLEGILKVSSNHFCGSLTIFYDPEIATQKSILESIGNRTLEHPSVVSSSVGVRQKGVSARTSSRLVRSTVTVILTIFFADTLFPMRILLYILIIAVSIPIYRRAYETIFKEKRIDLDSLNAFAMTIGLMADDLVVTAIMAMLIYLGDYAHELIASGSNRTLCMLMGDKPEDEYAHRNNRPLRTLTGITTLAAGIVLLPLPGPGLLVIPLGLAMLAKEYAWAGKVNTWLKEKLNTP